MALLFIVAVFLVFNFNASSSDYHASFGSIFRNLISWFKFRIELKSSPTPLMETVRYTPTPSWTPKQVLKQSPSQTPKQILKGKIVPQNQLTPVLTPVLTNRITYTPAPMSNPTPSVQATISIAPTLTLTPVSTILPQVTPTPSPTPSPVKITDIKNLLAYWNFDEGSGITLNDSSSNGINGRIWNTVSTAWLDEGKIGRALELDGYDDYIHFESLPVINLGAENQSYSISLWIKRNGNPSHESGIIIKDDGIGKYPFAVTIQKDGKVAFHLYDGANTAKVISDPIADNKWKYIVAIRDSANKQLRLYINNNLLLEAEDTTKGSLKNDDYVYIGRYPFGDNSFYHDSFIIDEARIYGKALTNAEVKALYDAGNTKVSSLLDYLRSLLQKAFSL